MKLEDLQKLSPFILEQDLGESWHDIKHAKLTETQSDSILDILDLVYGFFIKLDAEDHEAQQPEKREMITLVHRDRSTRLDVWFQTVHENLHGPFPAMGIGPHASGVEDLGVKITAEDAPGRAVEGGVDVVLFVVDEFRDGEGFGALGEEGAVVDEGLVGEGVVGDEDGGAGTAHVDGEDRAVFRMELVKSWFELCEELEEEDGVSDEGQGEGSRRVVGFPGRVENGKNGFEKSSNAEGDDEDEPVALHYLRFQRIWR